jgi:hypothetical protein
MVKLKGRGKSKKESANSCKTCGKELIVAYSGDGVKYPVFSCNEHGVVRNEWEAWWNLYSSRWRDKVYWDKPADKISCIIGYFCNKYKEFYGHSYTFEISNPIPYKSKDFVMARRMLAMFNGDAHEIRTYIRWVFSKKVKTVKYPITSIGFFTKGNIVNEYKHAKARSFVLKRHTPLPNDFLSWCNENFPDVFNNHDLKTWNDLNGLITYIKSYGDDGFEGSVIKEAVKRGMLTSLNTYRQLED